MPDKEVPVSEKISYRLKKFRTEPFISVSLILAWVAGTTVYFLNYGEHFLLLNFILRSLANFALLFLIIVSAFCLGEKLWERLKITFRTTLETFVFSTSLGLSILSYLILFLGAIRLLYRFSSYLLLSVIILSSVKNIRFFLRNLTEEHKEEKKHWKTGLNFPFSSTMKVILIISVCFYLIQDFTPPVNYDTLSYHLAIPKIFVREHKISYVQHNVYSNFPMSMEFLYVLSLLLYGDTLAKLMHFFMGILTTLGIYSFTRRYLDKKTAFLASFIFYNVPYVGMLSGWAFNDLMLSALGFLALAGLINWYSSKEESWLLVAAIYCGLSISTKYPALLFLLPFMVIFVKVKVRFFDKKSYPELLKRVSTFILIVFICASPWFLKNIIYNHNPVYPLFYSFFNKHFGHPRGETFNIQRFISQHSPGSLHLKNIPSILFRINTDKLLGPAFLLFLPVLIFTPSIKKEIKIILLFSLLYFFLWVVFTHQDLRFFIPCIAALSVPAAYAAHRISEESKPLTFFTHMVIVIVAFFNLSWMPLTIAKYDLLKVAVGMVDRDEFLLSSPFYQYGAFKYINDELPEDAKILFIAENQTYYCEREILSNSPLDTNIIVEITNKSSSAEDIYSGLKSIGITHILYNDSEAGRVAESYGSFNFKSKQSENLFIDFFTRGEYLKKLYSAGGLVLFKL